MLRVATRSRTVLSTPKGVAQKIKRKLFRRTLARRNLLRRFQHVCGRPLPLEAPKTFTEKLFVRMLEMSGDPDPFQTRLADKFLARDVVSERAGAQYLVPLLWWGKQPEDIPFDNLPDRYVIKTNHGSGSVIIGDRRIDRLSAVRKIHDWLAENYYWVSFEGQYLNIPPVIMVEEFIGKVVEPPLDYRFFCFNGEPGVIQVDDFEHSINPFYDIDWQPTGATYRQKFEPTNIPRPQRLTEMLDVARKLSAGIDFVRIDLYCIGDTVYFGEYSFTPAAGNLRFQPPCWDIKLGALWQTDGK